MEVKHIGWVETWDCIGSGIHMKGGVGVGLLDPNLVGINLVFSGFYEVLIYFSSLTNVIYSLIRLIRL